MNLSAIVPAKVPPVSFNSFRQKSLLTLVKNPNFKPLKDDLIRLLDRGRIKDALATLDRFNQHGITPDLDTYSVLLRSCIRLRDYERGKLVHKRLIDSGMEADSVVMNSLITLYSKFGDVKMAEEIFERMEDKRNLVSWSAMISCYAHNNREFDAIQMFYGMLQTGEYPNQFCFAAVTQACSNHNYHPIGLVIFSFIIKTGYFESDLCVGSALIDFFARNEDLTSARNVFDKMLERNSVVWTLMITRYSQAGLVEEAVNLFLEMECMGFEVDKFTLSSVISSCAELESEGLGKQLHSQAIRLGFAMDIYVACSLVDMYSKCAQEGCLVNARKTFDRMSEHNVRSWTAIITGYAQNGGDEEAINLFIRMLQGRTKPNHFTFSSILKACANLSDLYMGEQVCAHVIKYGLGSVNCIGNALISMYAHSGQIEKARKTFDLLYTKNLVSYDAMVDGYVKNLNSDEAFQLFHQMENSGIGFSSFTLASLLSSSATVGAMNRGQQLHARVIKSGFNLDKVISNALITMYSSCGCIEDAVRAFNEISNPNVISWTSMITGFAKHGYAKKALQLFDDMLRGGIKPNKVTYIAVLSACSHAGLIQEGWEHFNSMYEKHGIKPRMEHFACIIDLFGRSGCLEEALEFINSMPFKAGPLIWRTLLASCRIHNNLELGILAAKQILELDPNDAAPYVLLSNLYAATGQWDNASSIRKKMKIRKIDKEAGCCWVEIDNNVEKFYVGDTSHRLAHKIFEKLDELFIEIKGMGYVPNKNFVLHDIEEEQKEQYLFQHSEKIAIAFCLISTTNSKPIRIFKNLRVCGDCHNAIKFISLATNREIVVRDLSRFHHFKDGICSCGDYW